MLYRRNMGWSTTFKSLYHVSAFAKNSSLCLSATASSSPPVDIEADGVGGGGIVFIILPDDNKFSMTTRRWASLRAGLTVHVRAQIWNAPTAGKTRTHHFTNTWLPLMVTSLQSATEEPMIRPDLQPYHKNGSTITEDTSVQRTYIQSTSQCCSTARRTDPIWRVLPKEQFGDIRHSDTSHSRGR